MATALPPLSASSMRGWILNAPTCAPMTPRRNPGSEVATLLGGGGTMGWGSTSRGDYMGMQNPSPTTPWTPSPRSKVFGDADPHTRFSVTSHAHHSHPGHSPRVRRRILSNAPSEPDHPMFGLHDPMRKARLGKMLDRSLSTDSYMAPDPTTYDFSRPEGPPDRAHLATSFDHAATMGRHQSEARSKYLWPKWTAPVAGLKPVGQLVID